MQRGSLAGAIALTALLVPLGAPLTATAQAASPPTVAVVPAPSMPEFPQLTLSAEAWREVAQDRVAVTLYANHEAPQPAQAQARVNEQLNPALERLKGRKDLEVQSAGYRTDPVWKDSRIVAWRARGAIRVTAAPSEDFNRLVGELAGTLNVESVVHFLSREAREAVERELIADAVAAFRAKAQAASQALGYKGFAVRAVSVSDSGPGRPEPIPRVAMARAQVAESAPMPMAEGRTTVSVGVSGSVLLER
ncbi:SIMPL domain-containing protein [Burkholderiaceae bacterium FT117]|uniref:SIMPL domain-containing protein n=1 Tax=Zeimonas sediminis TaxID=2944268 RepID=UPI002343053B|nr:SIMPL domain-containing protein [Zeimonas sediminis]MCM5571751.1 SIMPL domain-containing protein [Zeimonas sediminis]